MRVVRGREVGGRGLVGGERDVRRAEYEVRGRGREEAAAVGVGEFEVRVDKDGIAT